MDTEDLQSSIQKLVEPYFREQGVELVELALKGSPRRRLLRIYVDRPEGITIDQCAGLSRGLADILDTYDPIEGTYVLEVSSPGLDRPLKSDRDFQRALGKDVRMQVEGRGELRGRLAAAEGDGLTIQTGDETVTVSRSQVLKANLHFEI
jgi:ribosome maturation factor RimP